VSKSLIAVVTCRKMCYPQHELDSHLAGANDRIQTLLDTWYKDYLARAADKIDLQFFVGRGNGEVNLPHYVELDAPDDYKGLPEKVRKIFEFALRAGYDFCCKTDDDGYFNFRKFKIVEADYAGIRKPGDYAGGGAYWLSRRSMELVVEHGIDDWAEDRGVGTLLAKHGIRLTDIPYIQPGRGIAAGYGHGCSCSDAACIEKRSKPVWEYFPDASVITQLSPEQVRACHRFYENPSRDHNRP
jgi:hypothetical protein